MAEAMASNEEILMCPICLDLLKTPATIPCGHSYCMDCITECWNQLDQKGVYSCPKCRETFCPRPALKKTTIVAELVEKVSKATIKDDPAGIEDVECDVCIGKKSKAVRSCLDCLLSYCKTHLKAHNDLHPGRKHSIVDATAKLHERICSRHGKVSEIFCRTDQSLICYLCTMDEHRGHDTVTAVAEWTEKQKQLGHSKLTFQQRIQRREKDVQELRKTLKTFKSSAQTAVDESEKMFDEMIRSINRRRSEVIKQIRAEEKAEVSRAEGLVKKVEQEIAELKRTEAELEQLYHTEDYIHILKTFKLISAPPECGNLPDLFDAPNSSFGAVKKTLSMMQSQIENLCRQRSTTAGPDIASQRRRLYVQPSSRSRPSFLNTGTSNSTGAGADLASIIRRPVNNKQPSNDYINFTLDPNTAKPHLHLSNRNTKVHYDSSDPNDIPDHPERFDWTDQVLCRESVTGRCYWEVDIRCGEIHVAASYKEISRKGNDSTFGENAQSWSKAFRPEWNWFQHNNKKTYDVHTVKGCSRIGVYVDHRAGILAFYGITSNMTLLHRIQTTFTRPLYPGYLVYSGEVQLLHLSNP